MELGLVYAGLAGACALLYAALFLAQRPSSTRTMIKAISVGALAMVALIEGGPLLLAAGLVLSAIGDGFLAQDDQASLKTGMAVFGAAHVAYALMFVLAGAGVGLGAGQVLVQVGVVALSGLAFWRLRPHLGAMTAPVSIYGAVVTVMAVLAVGMPPVLALAAAGAVLFFLSDGVLAMQLFARVGRSGQARLITDQAVWWLYWIGQAMITAGFLARPG